MEEHVVSATNILWSGSTNYVDGSAVHELDKSALLGLVQNIEVYDEKKQLTDEENEKRTFVGHLTDSFSNYGISNQDIAKYLGKSTLATIEKLKIERDKLTAKPALNKQKTEKLRKEFLQLAEKYVEKATALKEVEEKIANIQEYIDVCEKVASIGSKMKKKN